MKFAIIETGGKQYKVSVGQKLKVEKLNTKEGGNFVFDKVLLTADLRGSDPSTSLGASADGRGKDWDVKVGQPYLEGVKVEGKVLKQGRDKKKIVFKYKSKTRRRTKKGHRQSFTEVEVSSI